MWMCVLCQVLVVVIADAVVHGVRLVCLYVCGVDCVMVTLWLCVHAAC